MVLILVSMDRGGSYLYTGSKYKGIRRSYGKSVEGLQQLPFGGLVTKNTPGGRGLFYVTLMSPLAPKPGNIAYHPCTGAQAFSGNWPQFANSLFTSLALIVCDN